MKPLAPLLLLALLPLALLALAPACANDDSAPGAPVDALEEQSQGGGADLNVELTPDAQAPEDLRGLWASTTVFRGIAQHPLLGPLDERSTVVALVEVRDRQDGLGLETVTTTCFMDLHTEGSPVQSTVPAEFLALLGPSTRNLEHGDAGLAQGPYAEVFALHLDAPLTEPFPQAPNDTRIFDHDGDGKPGLSVRLTGLVDGEVFVAQRRIISWQASWDGQGFSGPVAQTLEELVLGAAPEVLMNYLPTHLPAADPSASTVEWRSLPLGSDCEDLASAQR